MEQLQLLVVQQAKQIVALKKTRLREELVKEQVQWILTYMQRESTDIQKENLLEKMKAGEVEFELAEDFFDRTKERIQRRR